MTRFYAIMAAFAIAAAGLFGVANYQSTQMVSPTPGMNTSDAQVLAGKYSGKNKRKKISRDTRGPRQPSTPN